MTFDNATKLSWALALLATAILLGAALPGKIAGGLVLILAIAAAITQLRGLFRDVVKRVRMGM